MIKEDVIKDLNKEKKYYRQLLRDIAVSKMEIEHLENCLRVCEEKERNYELNVK